MPLLTQFCTQDEVKYVPHRKCRHLEYGTNPRRSTVARDYVHVILMH